MRGSDINGPAAQGSDGTESPQSLPTYTCAKLNQNLTLRISFLSAEDGNPALRGRYIIAPIVEVLYFQRESYA